MAEQAPNPHSRVMLDPREVDAVGMPRVRLDWRLTEQDRHSVRRSQEVIGDALAASGLGRLRNLLGEESPPAVLVGNAHHMGTTRMHDDPKRGVVDRDLRMHSVPNLFVGGSSVFPTGGFANPTHTLLALSIRLADYLRHELGGRECGDSSVATPTLRVTAARG
jgi:choline dehydrogenase-like flavoprotein